MRRSLFRSMLLGAVGTAKFKKLKEISIALGHLTIRAESHQFCACLAARNAAAKRHVESNRWVYGYCGRNNVVDP